MSTLQAYVIKEAFARLSHPDERIAQGYLPLLNQDAKCQGLLHLSFTDSCGLLSKIRLCTLSEEVIAGNVLLAQRGRV